MRTATVTLRAALPQHYLQGFIDGSRDLDSVCKSLESWGYITMCSAEIDRDNALLIVDARLNLNLLTGLASIRGKDNNIYLDFYLQYRPLLYLLGEDASDYTITFTTPVSDPVKRSATDTVLFRFSVWGRPLPLKTGVRATRGGDIVRVDVDGDYIYCVAELLDENNVVYSRIVTQDCHRLLLSSQSTVDRSRFYVAVYAIDSSFMLHASLKQITIPVSTPVYAYFLDEPDKYAVIIENQERCKLSLYNYDGELIWSEARDVCKGRHLITMKNTLPPNTYYFLIEAESGGVQSYVFTLPPLKHFIRMTTDREIYYAGERIHLFLEPIDYVEQCEVTLRDLSGRRIWPSGRSVPGECEPLYVDTYSILRPATYIIDVKLYVGGTVIGRERKMISIVKPGSADLGERRICREGSLYIREEATVLPCIGVGEMCIPRSMKTSACLCFDGYGTLKDVCKFGEVCRDDGCRRERDVRNRIIVDERGMEYLLYSGGITPFVRAAEMCTGLCACVDENYEIRDWCQSGEICLPGKMCCVPELQADILKVNPAEIPRDILQKGTDIEIHFRLRRGNRIVKDFFRSYIILGRTREECRLINYRGIWVAKAHIQGNLAPGRHYIVFEIEAESLKSSDCSTTSYARRIPFTVLYSKDKEMDITIKSVSPQVTSKRQAERGAVIVLHMEIDDPFITSDSINITIGGKRMKIISITRKGSDYTISEFINSTIVASTSKIVVSAEHLGRKGIASIEYPMPDSIPIDVTILSWDPAVIFEQFFTGFEFNMVVGLRGDDLGSVSPDQFVLVFSSDTKILNREFYPTQVVDTQEGLLLRFREINYCDVIEGLDIQDVTRLRAKLLFKHRGAVYESQQIELGVIPCPGDLPRSQGYFCSYPVNHMLFGCRR